MKNNVLSLAAAVSLALATGTACAQANIFKFGVTEYTTHSRTNGVTGVGVPPGADAETGNAATLVVIYERMLTPNIGAELVLGIPPRVKAKATGTVAFLGDDVLSARNVSPTVLVNYHFGETGDRWRPYLSAGFNYTRFVEIRSRLANDIKMSDSWGWALGGGLNYAVDDKWGVFGSIVRLQTKTKLVAAGSTVLQTDIDLRPLVYTLGVTYKF